MVLRASPAFCEVGDVMADQEQLAAGHQPILRPTHHRLVVRRCQMQIGDEDQVETLLRLPGPHVGDDELDGFRLCPALA